jgi:tRNA A37 methylthiotransferase MiaB
MSKKVFISVLGCQRRELDASRVTKYLNLNNHKITKNPKYADILLLFTCAYKKSKEDQSITKLKEFSQHKGELIVLGCLPGINEERLKKEFKGKYLATKNLDKIDEFFPEFKCKLNNVQDANFLLANKYQNPSFKNPLKKFFSEFEFSTFFLKRCFNFLRGKMYVENEDNLDWRKLPLLRISYGCLGKCSYCVIPKGTGKLRSKPIKECIKEYKDLIENGHRHIMLSAEDTGTYGLDINSSLPELLSEMSKSDKGYDVKLGLQSLNPEYALKYKDKLLGFIKKGKLKNMKFDIQSGSNRILKLMNRNYDIKEVLKLCDELKKISRNLVSLSHFIVGFPSETDSDFKATVSVMEKMNLDFYYVFPYSDMPGSVSSRMPDKVPKKTKVERVKFIKSFFGKKGYHCVWGGHSLELIKKKAKKS